MASDTQGFVSVSTLNHCTGDDKFSSAATLTAPRNILSPDELTPFFRKLLNIAFTLYWREDQTNVQDGGVPGVNAKWDGAREKAPSICRLFIRGSELYLRSGS